jgi:hypothetical protein
VQVSDLIVVCLIYQLAPVRPGDDTIIAAGSWDPGKNELQTIRQVHFYQLILLAPILPQEQHTAVTETFAGHYFCPEVRETVWQA